MASFGEIAMIGLATMATESGEAAGGEMPKSRGCAGDPRNNVARRRGQTGNTGKSGGSPLPGAPAPPKKPGEGGAPPEKTESAAAKEAPPDSSKAEGGARPQPAPLSDFEKGIICGLVAVGMSHRQAALVIGCHRTTIDRALLADARICTNAGQVAQRARLLPLTQVIEAARTSWKAAVWLIEYFERVAPNDPEAPAMAATLRMALREIPRMFAKEGD